MELCLTQQKTIKTTTILNNQISMILFELRLICVSLCFLNGQTGSELAFVLNL